MRKYFYIFCLIMAIDASDCIYAETYNDATPVQSCSTIPEDAYSGYISKSESMDLCHETNLLRGVRANDIHHFSAYISSMKDEGYKKDAQSIAKEAVLIIRLRGLEKQPERWFTTIDDVYRAYSAFKGLVTPEDVIMFLIASGPAAKKISDEAFIRYLAVIKEDNERRGELNLK